MGCNVFMVSGVDGTSRLVSIQGDNAMEIVGKRTGLKLWMGVLVVLMVAGLACGSVAPTSTAEPVLATSAIEPRVPEPTQAIATAPAETAEPVLATSAIEPTIPEPTQAIATAPVEVELPGDANWLLDLLDGEPLIEGTFVTLKFDGEVLGGFDGCNSYGGRSQDGMSVADVDGRISVPPLASTAKGCIEPEGVLDQGDAYLSALMQGQRFRVDGDQLEIFDGDGVARLLFVRQMPLSGAPVDLARTTWRLVMDDESEGEFRPATMAFIDDRLIIGGTACRGFFATYRATYGLSEGSVRFPSKSMIWSHEPCEGEARMLEGEFGDFLTWAREYAVDEGGGSRRLRIWSVRGKTLTFEPLAPIVDDVVNSEWVLEAIVEMREIDPGFWSTRQTRVVEGTELTIIFDDHISGSAGCNSYGAEAKFGDGSIRIDAEQFFWQEKLCETEGVMEQEERYLEMLAGVIKFGVFGDGLYLQTEDDVFLVFEVRLGRRLG